MDRGEEKTRQLERKLKQASSENERLNEYNAHLTKELDRSVEKNCTEADKQGVKARGQRVKAKAGVQG